MTQEAGDKNVFTLAELEERWRGKMWLTERLDRAGIVRCVQSGKLPAAIRTIVERKSVADASIVQPYDCAECDVHPDDIDDLVFAPEDVDKFEHDCDFGSMREVLKKLPIPGKSSTTIRTDPQPVIAALERELSYLKNRPDDECVSISEHGFAACVINMRNAGKTDVEIARWLYREGQGCTKSQIGALLYRGNDFKNLQHKKFEEIGEKLLKNDTVK